MSLKANPTKDSVTYKFLIRPYGQPNTKPIIVTSSTPGANIPGLTPGAKYEATLVALTISGARTPAGNVLAFTQPAAGAPVLTSADPVGPTAGKIASTPPATGGPWVSYTYMATPRHGGSPITVTCANPQCFMSGLQPATIYDVTATTKNQADQTSTPSNSLPLATPPAG